MIRLIMIISTNISSSFREVPGNASWIKRTMTYRNESKIDTSIIRIPPIFVSIPDVTISSLQDSDCDAKHKQITHISQISGS
jgi:hypothetical protein